MSREDELLREFLGGEDLELTGPRWKVSRIRFKEGGIKKIRGTLKSIKKIINKVRGVLKTLRKFTQILAMIEALISDSLKAILNQIISTLERTLDSIGSTGLYFLTTFDYTKINTPFVVEEVEPVATSSQVKSQDTLSILDFFATMAEGYEEKKITKDEPTTNTFDGFNPSNMSVTVGNKKYSFGSHRAITYSEWIGCIAEAFVDPLDLPPGKFVGKYKRDEDAVDAQRSDFNKMFTGSVKMSDGSKIINTSPAIIKTGKPYLEAGTKVEIVIIGMAFPDITSLVSNMTILSRMFSGLIDRVSLEKDKKSDEDKKKALEKINSEEEKKSTLGKSGGLYDDIVNGYNSWNADVIKTNPASSGLMPGALRDFASQEAAAQNLVAGGAEPDFYGINLRALFLPLFVNVETIIGDLKGKIVPSIGLADLLDSSIAWVEDQLNEIELWIQKIEEIIEDILALLAINLSVLKISTNQGADDIYEQIINSQGFPTAGLDRPFFHFGLLFCSVDGFSANAVGELGSFDIKKYWANQQKEYDGDLGEEVKELGNGIKDLQKILGI